MALLKDGISEMIDGKRVITKKPELLAPKRKLGKAENCCTLRSRRGLYWRKRIWASLKCR